MTLNILLAAQHGIYLSADFRLTYSNGRHEDDLEAQKLVPVLKFEWCAMISFSGVAKTASGLDVGDWIAAQVSPGAMREKVDDVLGRLRRADTWLSQISGNNSISIVVAGYNQRRPFTYLLSNCQDLDGKPIHPRPSALRQFQGVPKHAKAIAFGDYTAFTNGARTRLEQFLETQPHKDHYLAVAEESAVAATKSKQSTISASCVIGRVFPTGDGLITPVGIDLDTAEYMPRFVRDSFITSGVAGIRPKVNDGVEQKVSWSGSSWQRQGRARLARFAAIHAFRNGAEPIAGPRIVDSKSHSTHWKIADGTEPPRITVHFPQPRRRGG